MKTVLVVTPTDIIQGVVLLVGLAVLGVAFAMAKWDDWKGGRR